MGNNSQFDEYAEEYKQAEISIAEYKKNAKDLVDINTVTLLTDPADLNSGKALFEQNCIPCHMADGGGGIGPNLTDNHWILGGGIKNVFNTKLVKLGNKLPILLYLTLFANIEFLKE